jgi:hypothetical protein
MLFTVLLSLVSFARSPATDVCTPYVYASLPYALDLEAVPPNAQLPVLVTGECEASGPAQVGLFRVVDDAITDEVDHIELDLDERYEQVASLAPPEPLDVLSTYAVVVTGADTEWIQYFTTGNTEVNGMGDGAPLLVLDRLTGISATTGNYHLTGEFIVTGVPDPSGMSYFEITEADTPMDVLSADFINGDDPQPERTFILDVDDRERCFTVTQFDAVGQSATSDPVCATPVLEDPIEPNTREERGCSTASASPALFSPVLSGALLAFLAGARRRDRSL